MNEANLNGNLIREYDKSQLGDEPDALFAVDILAAAENNNPVYGVEGAWGYGYEKKDSNSFGDANFERIYEWDDKNQLIKTKDGLYTTYYVYNNEGDRVAKYTERSETLYFNKFWSWHIDPANAFAGGQLSKHIFLGDTRIVTKLSQETNNYIDAEKQRLYFYYSDHLGSASLITDYKGNEYERLEYTPYGELWVDLSEYTGSTYLPFKFSAKEMDSETGLYYYGARYLDSKYSLWKSTDPALGEYIPKAPINEQSRQYNQNLPGMGGIFNPINANLYHYAGNNPVRYVDPDGREIYISVVDEAIVDYINKYSFYQYKLNEDGYLERDFSKPNNENNSRDYSYKIDQAIKSDWKIIINISNFHIRSDGLVVYSNVDLQAGGGATSTVYGSDIINITIAPTIQNTTIMLRDTCGNTFFETPNPEDILMHELVGHAVPMILHQQGDAVYLENYIRLELNLLPRVMKGVHSCF